MLHPLALALLCTGASALVGTGGAEGMSLLEASSRAAFPVARGLLLLAPSLPLHGGAGGGVDLAPDGGRAGHGTALHAQRQRVAGRGRSRQTQQQRPQRPLRWKLGFPAKPSLAPRHVVNQEPSATAAVQDAASAWLAKRLSRALPVQELPATTRVARTWRRVRRMTGNVRGRFAKVGALPKDWKPFLRQQRLRLVHQGRTSRVFVGACSPPFPDRVALKVTEPGPVARNEVQMLRRLQGSGNVIQYFGSEEFPNATYILMAAADGSLHDWLRLRREAGEMQVPFRESLPILVDLLRGIRDLEREGIVQCSLSERNVLMRDGRPLLSDFGTATVIDPSDKDFGHGAVGPCSSRIAVDVSLSRMPPETIRGLPTGPSNNVFQVGAIFALMSLGYVPMTRMLLETVPEVSNILAHRGWDWRIDRRAQSAIRSRFAVERDPGYRALFDKDVQEILSGLLATSLDRRWTAVGALEQALAIAKRRGIPVPAERAAPTAATAQFQSDWE